MPADSEVLIPIPLNLTLVDADTEYTVALPKNCKAFTWQSRGGESFRYAWVIGKVAGPTAPYMTNKEAGSLSAPFKFVVHPDFVTLYIASATAGTVVEILCYVSGASPY